MTKIIIRAFSMAAFGFSVLVFLGLWGKDDFSRLGDGGLLWGGLFGFMALLLSLAYSLRKRYFRFGKINLWLRVHEITAVVGTAVIVWHSGLRMHNLVGWAALLLMIVLCISGMVGRYIYFEMNRELARLKKSTAKDAVVQETMYWKDRFQYWRRLHMPLNGLFLSLVVLHLLATAYYGGWHQ